MLHRNVNELYASTVLVSGFAMSPKGIPVFEAYKNLGVILVVQRETHEIVAADFTFVSELTKDYLHSMVIGKNALNDAELLFDLIQRKLFIPSKGAVIQAVRSALERYRDTLVGISGCRAE